MPSPFMTELDNIYKEARKANKPVPCSLCGTRAKSRKITTDTDGDVLCKRCLDGKREYMAENDGKTYEETNDMKKIVVDEFQFSTLAELRDFLSTFEETDLSAVLPNDGNHFNLRWVEETLTDGSLVNNATITTR